MDQRSISSYSMSSCRRTCTFVCTMRAFTTSVHVSPYDTAARAERIVCERLRNRCYQSTHSRFSKDIRSPYGPALVGSGSGGARRIRIRSQQNRTQRVLVVDCCRPAEPLGLHINTLEETGRRPYHLHNIVVPRAAETLFSRGMTTPVGHEAVRRVKKTLDLFVEERCV